MTNQQYYYNSQFERWAHSAWTRLHLSPPCDLLAVSMFLKYEVNRRALPPGIMGMFVRESNCKPAIFIAQSMPIESQRWVWAHEIGHGVINHKLPGILKFECSVYNNNDEAERNADEFAFHLLMPSLAVSNKVSELKHSRTNNRIGTLARLFGVNRIDMQNKLDSLGL